MQNNVKKVLIINKQSIKKNNATGLTLESLWGAWPRDRIIEFHAINPNQEPERKIDVKSFVFKRNLFDSLLFGRSVQKVNSFAKQGCNSNSGSKNSILSHLRKAFILFLDLVPIRFTEEQIHSLESFRPDVIYTLGASVSVLSAAYKLSVKYDIPITIHFMDNWIDCIQWSDVFFSKIYHRLLIRKFDKCLKRMPIGLAISPEMAEEYEKRFNIPFCYLMNSVDPRLKLKDYNDGFNAKKYSEKKLNFVYAGGLHMERWKALSDISNSVHDILPDSKVVIYTSKSASEQYKAFFPNNTIFHESVDHDAIFHVYEKADILIHAEANNSLLQNYFKYSISTKIPEYLASNRPILFLGPKDSGVYKYLNKYGAAFLASTKNELEQTLKDLFLVEKRIEILNNAEFLFNEMHNTNKVRETLCNAIDIATTNLLFKKRTFN